MPSRWAPYPLGSGMKFLVERGSAEELPAFVDLLEELGAWLWSRGIQQWPPGSNRKQLPPLQRYLASGELILARSESQLVGGFIVSGVPTPEWAGRSPEAAYLHKLAVARPWGGRGLGVRLLQHSCAWAKERGASRLRLDCWDGNPALRAFYRNGGFEELDAVPSHGSHVRLFELVLPRPAARLGDEADRPWREPTLVDF